MNGWLRRMYGRHKRIWNYLFFGACTTVVSIGSFFLFTKGLGFPPLIANVLSWFLAVGFAYVTNRRWVFDAMTRSTEILTEIASFYGARLLTLGLEELLLWLLLNRLHMGVGAGKLLGQFVVLGSNYLLSKWVVFQKPNQ